MIKKRILQSSLLVALVLPMAFGAVNAKASNGYINLPLDPAQSRSAVVSISKSTSNESSSTNAEVSVDTKIKEIPIKANAKYENTSSSSVVTETGTAKLDLQAGEKPEDNNSLENKKQESKNVDTKLVVQSDKNTELKKQEIKDTEKKVDSRKNADSINKFIYSLNYNRDAVLATQGEPVNSFIPKQGIKKGNKFVVVEKTKRSIETSPVDVAIIDSTVSRSYPGALQLANKNLTENRPDVLTVARKPINISISLPGLGLSNYTQVENPNYRTVSAAVDSMIDKWSDNYSGTHTLPAITEYKESMVHSRSQIAAALNVNANFLEKTLGIDFDAISNGEKQVMIASYKQIFYTVNADLPESPSDVFADTVTPQDLQIRGVNNDNAPLMVSKVAYGRRIFVKLETTSKDTNINSAFNLAMKNLTSKGSSKYQDVLDGSDFTAVVLGGDAQVHNRIVSKNFDDIRDIIKDNATFSLTNPGYPLSYTSVFLKDGSVATVHNQADYIETKAQEFTKGRINIYHKGAYVAQFKITWDEVNYDQNGNEVVEHKAWDENWWDKTSSFTTTIPLPANAKNIKVYAREATGLFWDRWWTVINDTVDLNKNINLTLWGTTLNPHGSLTVDNN